MATKMTNVFMTDKPATLKANLASMVKPSKTLADSISKKLKSKAMKLPKSTMSNAGSKIAKAAQSSVAKLNAKLMADTAKLSSSAMKRSIKVK